ncbi:MAG: PH domain-containing protein [Bacteroidetes bacterium]|jgi:putative membrane protein|nr:PH domain-containing protein [Bacteroidota bacterium]
MAEQEKSKARTLVEVSFDKRLKMYISIYVMLIMAATIVGILLIPFWLILGNIYLSRYFENLHCELTTRSLKFKKGVMVQVERTIPLDKIQDLTFREGPILRYLGLSTLKIETAGQSAQGAADMSLTGIVDARQFREQVIEQRDRMTDIHSGHEERKEAKSGASDQTLQSILEVLQRIEKKLDRN